jgi:hypothetical protein
MNVVLAYTLRVILISLHFNLHTFQIYLTYTPQWHVLQPDWSIRSLLFQLPPLYTLFTREKLTTSYNSRASNLSN